MSFVLRPQYFQKQSTVDLENEEKSNQPEKVPESEVIFSKMVKSISYFVNFI